jgi:hypothetical protein
MKSPIPKIPAKHVDKDLEKMPEEAKKALLGPQKKIRRVTSSLKLNNNLFFNWDGFNEAIGAVLKDPQEVTWLDLSFNQFETIGEEIASYTKLSSLYLHGNHIEDLKEIKKLTPLTSLKSLTLHGCPIEEVKNYRSSVIGLLPWLRQLDFSPVTKQEQSIAKQVLATAERRKAAAAARREAVV